MNQEIEKAPRGFGAMSPDRQRQIASEGGKAAHRAGKAHQFTTEEARDAGRLGGIAISQNRDHMAAIGRKGGGVVSANIEHMREIGRKGGAAVSGDKGHMAEIGRKGGRAKTR